MNRNAKRDRAIQLHEEQGLKPAAIAVHVGTSPRTVRRYLEEHEEAIQKAMRDHTVDDALRRAYDITKRLNIDTAPPIPEDPLLALGVVLMQMEAGVFPFLDQREADQKALRTATANTEYLIKKMELDRDARANCTELSGRIATLNGKLTDVESDKELAESRVQELKREQGDLNERIEDLKTTAGMVAVDLIQAVDGAEAAEHLEIHDDTLRKVKDMAVERLAGLRGHNNAQTKAIHGAMEILRRFTHLSEGELPFLERFVARVHSAWEANRNANELRRELMDDRVAALEALREVLGHPKDLLQDGPDELGPAVTAVVQRLRVGTVQLAVAVYGTQTVLRGKGDLEPFRNLVNDVQAEWINVRRDRRLLREAQQQVKWTVLLWSSLGAVAGFLATVAAHDFGWLPL